MSQATQAPAKAKAAAKRRQRTVTAGDLAKAYGSGRHGSIVVTDETTGRRSHDGSEARYAVMWQNGRGVWQQITPRRIGDTVSLMSRGGVVATVPATERLTVSDDVRDGDVAVSWHECRAVNADALTTCTVRHLRGYDSGGTSYCFARKASTGAATVAAAQAAAKAQAEAEAAALTARKAKAQAAAAKAKATKAAKAAAKATAGDAALAAVVGAA